MNAGNLVFVQPLWLLLLPVYWLLPRLRRVLRRRWPQGAAETAQAALPRAIHPLLHLVPRPSAHVGTKYRGSGPRPGRSVPRFLGALGLGALIVALAQPVRIGQRLPQPPPRQDIGFIVDTSVAMVLRDYTLEGEPIDRMSLLKALLSGFVDRLEGARMGVIVYGEHAYTLVPPTRDPDLVRAMVARIRTTMAGRYNALGEAIALGVREAMENDQGGERHRVLVLLAAGGPATGGIAPRAAAELARKQGIPLYTVAIGAADPAAGEQGTTGLVYHPAGTQLLADLAELGGGLGFRATDRAAIEEALAAIQARELRPAEAIADQRRLPLYYWPLLGGLLLLAAGEWARCALANLHRTPSRVSGLKR